MRIYKPTYRGRDGQTHDAEKFYAELRTADGRVLRLPGFVSERQTTKLGDNVQKLIDCVANHELPTGDLALWIESLPNRTAKILSRWGLLSVHRLAAGKGLAEHLADWKADLLAKGRTANHANLVHARVARLLKACKVTFVSEIQPGTAQAAIAALRVGRPHPTVSTDEPDKRQGPTKGLSLQTCNHITTACKAFTHWLCRDGRLQADPLMHLTKYNVRTDRRHDRRALSDVEITALIQAAERGPTVLGITGPARAMLYRVAVGTGFRKAELASLTPQSFNLNNEPPTITVRAGFSKHRREDTQPIRRDLADTLRVYLQDKAVLKPLFNLTQRTYRLIRTDLANARAAFINDAGDNATERSEREKSGFCRYVDDAGRYADFHALRHTFITRLVKSNASVKVCQELARHSDPKLTFAVYSHVGMADTSRALDNLPSMESQQATLKSGTDNRLVNAVAKVEEIDEKRWARCWARKDTISKNSVESGRVNAGYVQDEKNPHETSETCGFIGENGESGIRTRGTGCNPYTGLANRRLQPLGHLSRECKHYRPEGQKSMI